MIFEGRGCWDSESIADMPHILAIAWREGIDIAQGMRKTSSFTVMEAAHSKARTSLCRWAHGHVHVLMMSSSLRALPRFSKGLRTAGAGAAAVSAFTKFWCGAGLFANLRRTGGSTQMLVRVRNLHNPGFCSVQIRVAFPVAPSLPKRSMPPD
jgi:hypothetical protein